MEKKIPFTPLVLTWLGFIPFLLAPIFLYFTGMEQSIVMRFIEVYAVVILAFLGGIDWGMATMQAKDRNIGPLIIWSIIPAVAAWLIYVFNVGLLLEYLAILYILQWYVNYQTFSKGLCPYWYLKLRSIISPVVIVFILITSFLLYHS